MPAIAAAPEGPPLSRTLNASLALIKAAVRLAQFGRGDSAHISRLTVPVVSASSSRGVAARRR